MIMQGDYRLNALIFREIDGHKNTLPMLTGYQTIIMSYYISIARLQSYQVSHSVKYSRSGLSCC